MAQDAETGTGTCLGSQIYTDADCKLDRSTINSFIMEFTFLAAQLGESLKPFDCNDPSSYNLISRFVNFAIQNGGTGGVPINDEAPVAIDDINTYSLTLPLQFNLLSNDSDPQGEPITVTTVSILGAGSTAITGPNTNVPTGTPATLTVSPDGTLVFNANGYDQVINGSYVITDTAGNTDTALIRFNPGVAGNNPPVDDNEATMIDSDESYSLNVLANATDAEGDTLTITGYVDAVTGNPLILGTSQTDSFGGTVFLDVNGVFSYSPGTAFDGFADGTETITGFTYTISDGQGGTDTSDVSIVVTTVGAGGGTLQCPSGDLTVPSDAGTNLKNLNIGSGNTVVSVNGSASNVGTALPLSGAGDEFSLSSSGQLAYNTNGVYDSASNGNYSESFTFVISDGTNQITCSYAIIVVVNNTTVNSPPIANNDSFDYGASLFNQINVLGNDTDPDGDTLSIIGINSSGISSGNSVNLPSGATITLLGNGNLEYVIGSNTGTTDSFTYTISDGQGGTDTATVNVTNINQNQPPFANLDYRSVDSAGSITFNVLANDSDPENDVLTVTGFRLTGINGNSFSQIIPVNGTTTTLPNGSTVSITSGGSVTFVSNGNVNDYLAFAYDIEDTSGNTDTGSVEIEILQGNQPTTGSGFSPLFITSDQTHSADLLVNTVDPEGDNFSLTRWGEINDGTPGNFTIDVPRPFNTTLTGSYGETIRLDVDGSWTYDPNGAFDAGESYTNPFSGTTVTLQQGDQVIVGYHGEVTDSNGNIEYFEWGYVVTVS